jgi:hypothetical protein
LNALRTFDSSSAVPVTDANTHSGLGLPTFNQAALCGYGVGGLEDDGSTIDKNGKAGLLIE